LTIAVHPSMIHTMDSDEFRYRAFKDLGQILSFFEISDSEDESVSNIARALGMHPSKISRMLRSMEVQGLFERNPDTGRYRIGARFLQMGLLYVLKHPLRRVVFPHVEQAARDVELLVGWAIFKSDKVVIVDRLRYGDDPAMHVLGSEVPLHSTAYGKLFLAYGTDDEKERILKTIGFVPFTSRTVTDGESFGKELVRIRDRGYAFDDEETREGIRGLAAPVFDAQGSLALAFSVAGRTSDLTDKRLPELIKYLTDKAFFISRQLGYEGRVVTGPPKLRTRGRPSLKGPGI
jgi:IclR family transcriptional regulator, KDG regulon repressor